MTPVLAGIAVVDLTGRVRRAGRSRPGRPGRRGHPARASPTTRYLRPAPPPARGVDGPQHRGRSSADDPGPRRLLGDGRRRAGTRPAGHGVEIDPARAAGGLGPPLPLRPRRAAGGVAGRRPRHPGRRPATSSPPATPTGPRCAAPSRWPYAHVGPEAAFAALTGLAVGAAPADRRLHPGGGDGRQHGRRRSLRPGPGPGPAPGRQHRPHPGDLAVRRRLRVSFGLRGGKARIPSLETLTDATKVGHAGPHRAGLVDLPQNTAPDEELAAIEEAGRRLVRRPRP